MPRMEWEQPVPKHLAPGGDVKYTESSFTVTLSSDAYRNSPMWRKCEECGRDCIGDDGLERHLNERHPEMGGAAKAPMLAQAEATE